MIRIFISAGMGRSLGGLNLKKSRSVLSFFSISISSDFKTSDNGRYYFSSALKSSTLIDSTIQVVFALKVTSY